MLVLLDMVQCISWLTALLVWVFAGVLMGFAGIGLVCH